MNTTTENPDTNTTFTLDELARWEETFQFTDTAPTLTREALDEVTE